MDKFRNGMKAFGANVREVLGKTRKTLTIKKALKVEHYVIFGVYAMVFLVAGYFLLINSNSNLLPESFSTYEISASDTLIGSNLRSLYLDDVDVMSGELDIGNGSARLIVSEKPFNFVFNPKRKVPENTTAEITLSFYSPSTEVYLNGELIIPDLDGFIKVVEFENEEVWVRSNLVIGEGEEYFDGGNAREFVYANFPGRNIYAFGDIDGGVPVVTDYEAIETRIDTRFRDNLKLAVYVEGDLEISFVKQDLNMYIGKDEYTVEVMNLRGDVYFREVYGDDGDKWDSEDEVGGQEFMINVENLERNIYYVVFTRDENNKASDSYVKNIKINSNKDLIIGKSLPMDAFDFYMEVTSPQEVGFKYWWTRRTQEIKISGNVSKIIDLDESWLNELYEQNLTRGEYNFEIDNGMVWVYAKVISPTKENWFYFPKEEDKRLINSEILLIDKAKLEISGDMIIYTGMINIEDGSKIKIQVLDKLETYFKEIKLVL
ncbi:MAG: hypothetical protein IH845_05095 [Nanoarchaeota archaeon]|nr:hypothetical protein [Nanoarchaeota archaeon]